jgi:preprotein translocase subunit SecG
MSGSVPDRGTATGMPRWVKVFLIIAVVLALVVGILLLTGHGPGRHIPGGGNGGHSSPAGGH